MTNPTIRLARLEDTDAIASFTSDTFSWGDYVADEFQSWLAEPDLGIPVVTDERDRPVAVARVKMLSAREGWLSAARVHPDHRRRGLGSALNDWCVGWVAQRGGQVARLQVETDNAAAHNQVIRLAYRPVMSAINAIREVGREPIEPTTNGGQRVIGPERLERAPRTEAEMAYVAWSTSELARAARAMFATDLWAWRQMTPDDALASPVWHCPSGWIMAEEDDGDLLVRWMVCTPDDGDRLVRATVDLAHQLGLGGLEVVAPNVDWLTPSLTEHGLDPHPTRIYEKPL